MLVIISDLHLTDGSSETVHQGTLRVFRERLRSLAYAASWRAGGKYRPIEDLTVVLLGDIVDVLRSSQWLEGAVGRECSVRPWSDPRQPEFVNKVDAITEAVLRQNAVFFTLLRELRGTSIATVPPATSEGRPALAGGEERDCDRVPVRVHIHYMTGNHDWYFHLPHAAYDPIRAKLATAMGLENDPHQPFPHDPEEPAAGVIRQVFAQHRVFARHGDIYDPFNYEDHRDASSLGDAIVIELVTKFATEVKAKLGDRLPPECLNGLNEIDNVRPLMMVPVWVGGLLRRTCPDPRLHRQVQEIWSGLVDCFLSIPFVRDRLDATKSSLKGKKLKLALIISKRLLRPEGSRLLCFLHEKANPPKKSYYPFAIQEKAFKNRRAQFFIYGHTHRHEIVPLDSGFDDSQIYLNSGTWRPVYELARLRPGREAFAGYNTMTYLAFFRDDERSGRTFESWSGSLAKSSSSRAWEP
jgi:UDP-2,3-diacylglucosamine pyrophosphatase LpxH